MCVACRLPVQFASRSMPSPSLLIPSRAPFSPTPKPRINSLLSSEHARFKREERRAPEAEASPDRHLVPLFKSFTKVNERRDQLRVCAVSVGHTPAYFVIGACINILCYRCYVIGAMLSVHASAYYVIGARLSVLCYRCYVIGECINILCYRCYCMLSVHASSLASSSPFPHPSLPSSHPSLFSLLSLSLPPQDKEKQAVRIETLEQQLASTRAIESLEQQRIETLNDQLATLETTLEQQLANNRATAESQIQALEQKLANSVHELQCAKVSAPLPVPQSYTYTCIHTLHLQPHTITSTSL